MVKESLITVVAEEDMIATTTVTAHYLEVKEDAIECSSRSFKIATATRKEPEALMSHLFQNTQMILRQTVGRGAKSLNVTSITEYSNDIKANHWYGSQGRTWSRKGKDLQGRHMVISLMPKRNCHGIGYQLYEQRRSGRI